MRNRQTPDDVTDILDNGGLEVALRASCQDQLDLIRRAEALQAREASQR